MSAGGLLASAAGTAVVFLCVLALIIGNLGGTGHAAPLAMLQNPEEIDPRDLQAVPCNLAGSEPGRRPK